MDARIGLDYIVENREYISKLGSALETNNTTVKKQVFELLSALCAYNSDGYSRAIETLEYYKNLKKERYRFKIVVDELEKATVIEYQIALLAFTNCVIISAASLQDRLRIRNEFIGLKVLPILTNIRRIAQSVGDIIVQLDVFEEQRECDEAQSLQGPSGINLNSHLDVFYAILRQVADTPQEIPFLSLLQHLLRIDPKEPISDIIWDTTEKLVHRATLLENHEDSTRLLRTPSIQKFNCPNCRGGLSSPITPEINSTSTINRKQCIVNNSNNTLQSVPTIISTVATSISNTNTGGAPAPAPPPPPPPPDFKISQFSAPPPPPPQNSFSGIPPAPPPPLVPNHLSNNNLQRNLLENQNRPMTPNDLSGFNDGILLPQQDTPAPKAKMKTINWNKIPPNKVIGKRNIWTLVADSHQNSPMADLDWNEMEGLFCLQLTSVQGSPKLGRETNHYFSARSGGDTVDRKMKKENSEITLLDGKRSLNVNIFLKQFRSSNEDIIELIRNGEHDDIGSEKLRGLLKILPEVDELDMLKNFDGDKQRLGNAEKFLLQLLKIPNYKLRIESMLLKEDFAVNISYLEPCINAILYAGNDLINNKMLQEVLYMVVVAGNFLNSGGYAGNAAGVKLSSLQKLTDIRANKPGMNLIHFVALQCEKRNSNLLDFPVQMTTLDNASKTTSEQIYNEINTLETRIRKIKKQVELPTTDIDIKHQMMEFLQVAESEVSVLQRGMKEIELMRIKLAEFFCEDPLTFKIEECLKIFQNFCDKFKQAVKENERRRIQEEQANLRKKQREEQIAKRAKQLVQSGTPISDSENTLLIDPSFDPRCSPALSRRGIASFNNSADGNFNRDDGISPDITPNGSLRRRRSRVLAGEDDSNLMEFLRSSGHGSGSRERKSSLYGSLDRSWARRARSGTPTKKRPDLLNIDFGTGRERPKSPSPLPEEPKPIQTEEPRPRISKDWRQKIESWLQANENDEKYNEEYKRRRRLANNRWSLENESESEKNKLGTLPEEKITVSINGAESYKRVYSDWKPSSTLEKTDVVGTIKAIADVQNNRDKASWRKSVVDVQNNRDKASWRKSVLNISSSNMSEDNDTVKLKRQHSTGHTPPLHSIVEEDRRKCIQKLGDESVSDRLQIYIRRSSEPTEEDNSHTIFSKSNPSSITNTTTTTVKLPLSVTLNDNSYNKLPNSISNTPSEKPITGKRFVRILDRHNDKYSRIEIDSDNIETPPLARRTLTGSNNSDEHEKNMFVSKPLVDKPADDDLGNFNRFSSARRTRRYKRPTDYSSGNEDTSPASVPSQKTNSENKLDILTAAVDNKEDRLKHWQDRLNDLDTKSSSKTPGKTITKLEKVGRHISSINQADVREAIRNLKSPTGTPERIWSPPREIMKVDSTINKPIPITIIKVTNHELNDEGFEETQSLVSDTASHGKDSTSSCNEANDPTTTNIKRQKPIRMTSTDSAATNTSSDGQKYKSNSNLQNSQIQNFIDRNKRGLDRSRSMRTPTSQTPNNTSIGGTFNSSQQLVIPRRTNSLRKSDSNTSNASSNQNMKGKDVERSSSRASLRSSRSSLNSAISTNTVRKMPLKAHLTISSSPSKRSLTTQNTSLYARPFSSNNINHHITNSSSTTNRVPASRSSSSGSSIGPGVRRPPIAKTTSTSLSSALVSTSFKENQQSSSNSSNNKTTAARNAILSNRLNLPSSMSGSKIGINNNLNISNSNTGTSHRSKISGTTSTSRVSGFMRPTASSVTKRQQTDGKGNK